MARNGCFKQMSHHSTTSQYGTFSRAPRYFTKAVDEHLRNTARSIFSREIKGGAFVDEWTRGGAKAEAELARLVQAKFDHPMSRVEDRVLELTRHVVDPPPQTPRSAWFTWQSFVFGAAVGAMAVLAAQKRS